MTHKSEVANYAGSMEALAEEIGNLRYDALAKFLELLANKIEADGKKDESRGRVKLSDSLYQSADKLMKSKNIYRKGLGYLRAVYLVRKGDISLPAINAMPHRLSPRPARKPLESAFLFYWL